MTPDLLALIRNSDNSKLEEFLKSYPYGYKRKVLILELIDQHKAVLENGYINMAKNLDKEIIDFKVWAFNVIDKTFDKIQDMPISTNDKLEIDPVIKSIIGEEIA